MANDEVQIPRCPKCHHWDGWGDLRGSGCRKTIERGPCNSDYRDCCCKDPFHFSNRCTETRTLFTIEEANDYRKRYPFLLLDGRCGNESYGSSGPCEDHISSEDRTRIDEEKEARFKRYEEEREQAILARRVQDAMDLLEVHGFTVTRGQAS